MNEQEAAAAFREIHGLRQDASKLITAFGRPLVVLPMALPLAPRLGLPQYRQSSDSKAEWALPLWCEFQP